MHTAALLRGSQFLRIVASAAPPPRSPSVKESCAALVSPSSQPAYPRTYALTVGLTNVVHSLFWDASAHGSTKDGKKVSRRASFSSEFVARVRACPYLARARSIDPVLIACMPGSAGVERPRDPSGQGVCTWRWLRLGPIKINGHTRQGRKRLQRVSFAAALGIKLSKSKSNV